MKTAKMFLLLIGLTFSLSACASKYQQLNLSSITQRPRLSSEDSVFLAMPENGRYETIVYQGSGEYAKEAFVTALSKHVKDFSAEYDPATFEASLKKAQAKGSKILIFPEIKHWEDRATEWSGRPDRIEIQVRIVDVASGKELDSILLMGKSKWATFGGDHPQDLLEKPVTQYIDSLYV